MAGVESSVWGLEAGEDLHQANELKNVRECPTHRMCAGTREPRNVRRALRVERELEPDLELQRALDRVGGDGAARGERRADAFADHLAALRRRDRHRGMVTE